MTNQRLQLKKVYRYVLMNWAVSTKEIAAGTKLDVKDVRRLTKRLESKVAPSGWTLLAGTHVNGEREVTWQTYYDIQNESDAEKNGMADFDAVFPAGVKIAAGSSHRGNTGPRYTDAQIAEAAEIRLDKGESWKEIARMVGVKSPAHFSKVVRSRYPKVK